ncbi:anti-sigma factor [Parendozoicomonas haliclonae]|uniref:Anti-sigma-K factor rskA n=1 Tax=Parendozoicomonas haliclonae TaxID=1960125 RepID=A0A1X7APG5_9GAMM|nr:anti-sigma factor [Parendozoicomonas haliclonae]SMA49998.1 Anti-sigma-K factor rskA [Parendozoicomonas haliclonae]
MSDWNLSDPEQRHQAAADYVLGLLSGADLTRFEALLSISHEAQRDVQQWREHLNILNDELKPQTPPSSVWKNIARATKPESLWSSLRFWQGTGVGVAAALVVSLSLWLSPASQELDERDIDYVYVIQGSGSQPEWIVNASLNQNKVFVETVQPDVLPNGQVCELWLMVKGQEPVSLGILPKSGINEVVIDPQWRNALQNSPLVITLEKPEGAPNGYQMGPVLARGQWTPVNKSI